MMVTISEKKKLVFLASLPPPLMGPTVANEIIMNSKLKDDFDFIHLDTSDHRHMNTLNKLDLWNLLFSFKHYFMLVGLILKKWPSIIYLPICQTTIGYFRDIPFILIGKIFRRKIICHLRGGNFKNWYLSASALTRWFVRQVHSLIDGQIVLGECLRGLFRGILPDEKIFVVPNGANFGKLVFVPERKQLIDYKKVRILFLSNLMKEKGLFDVLEAIPEVMRFSENIEFIFAGEWQNKEVKRQFDRFIKSNSNFPIRLLGPVYGGPKQDLLSTADIFVFPTYYPAEGHPWVIIEAMAAGLPIITTDQGAITESVKDGINGFIIEKRNALQIAEKIIFLINHPDVRKKMGEESRRIYLENFTEEKMIERLTFAIQSVLFA